MRAYLYGLLFSVLASPLFGQVGASGIHYSPTVTRVVVAATDAPASWKSVARYRCDGTADDVQINAAIQSLNHDPTVGRIGGVVELSPGTFTIAAPINIDLSWLTLKGQGCYITMVKAGTYSGDGIRFTQTSYCSGWVHLRDFGLYGNSTAATGCGIRADRAYCRSSWDGTALTGTLTNTSKVVTNVSDISLFTAHVNDTTGVIAGTRVKGDSGLASYTRVDEVDTANNTITLASAATGTGETTLTIDQTGYDFRLENLFIQRWAEDGIRSSQCWGWTLDNVVIEYCKGDGLSVIAEDPLEHPSAPKLTGCKIITNGGHGIRLRNTQSGMFSNNEIGGGRAGYGIYLCGSSGAIIDGNRINTVIHTPDKFYYECGSACIFAGGFYDGSTYQKARNNVISNNILLDASTCPTFTALRKGGAVAAIDHVNDEVDATSHGFADGAEVIFDVSGGTLPTATEANINDYTSYYAKPSSAADPANSFKLFRDAAMSVPVDFTSAGSGSMYVGRPFFTDVSDTALVKNNMFVTASPFLGSTASIYIVHSVDVDCAGCFRIKSFHGESAADTCPTSAFDPASTTFQQVHKCYAAGYMAQSNIVNGNVFSVSDQALNGAVWDHSDNTVYGENAGLRFTIGGKVSKVGSGTADMTFRWGYYSATGPQYGAGAGDSKITNASTYLVPVVVPADADAAALYAATPWYVSNVTGTPNADCLITITAPGATFDAGVTYDFGIQMRYDGSLQRVVAP